MKTLTYEDWMKNPTPRVMWVWNEDKMHKVKRKVVYVLRNNYARVITIDDDNSDYESYNYCAEIEEPKTRRMTNQELAWWLREKPTREYKFKDSNYICGNRDYVETKKDKEVEGSILIREDDGEWKEPLVEDL